MEILSNKIPLQSIKGLIQVNLKDHASLITIQLLEMRDNLLDNDSIV